MAALLAGHRHGRLVRDQPATSHDATATGYATSKSPTADVADTPLRRGWATVYVYRGSATSHASERYHATQADAGGVAPRRGGLCGGDFHRLRGG